MQYCKNVVGAYRNTLGMVSITQMARLKRYNTSKKLFEAKRMHV